MNLISDYYDVLLDSLVSCLSFWMSTDIISCAHFSIKLLTRFQLNHFNLVIPIMHDFLLTANYTGPIFREFSIDVFITVSTLFRSISFFFKSKFTNFIYCEFFA